MMIDTRIWSIGEMIIDREELNYTEKLDPEHLCPP
jgi:hypothetical protein